MPHTLNCLVVDDDPMFVLVANSILSTLTSGNIYVANSGRDGIQALLNAETRADVVFLDLNMPDGDGLAFIRSAHEAGFQGAIVVSSGESASVIRATQAMAKLLGIRILGTLKKPLTIEAVAGVLANAGSTTQPSPTNAQSQKIASGFILTPYYQPQYQLKTGQIAGLEALIRLTAEDGRVHGPAELFDKIDGIKDLTEISMTIAATVMKEFRPPIPANGIFPTVSINFDASVLEQPEVVADLQRAVIELSLDPRKICLEVTEKSLPKDPSRLVEALTRLRMSGFDLSLDDYGMGASSFELLRLCPFSEIKVDRSIVAASTHDHVTRKFLHSVAALSRDLELVSVAEGVETKEELAEVSSAGMDRVQGFYFSRPLPFSALSDVLKKPALGEV